MLFQAVTADKQALILLTDYFLILCPAVIISAGCISVYPQL